MSHNGSVTIKEAARLLDVSEKTLSRYVQKGRIKSETVQDKGRKRKYFKIETLESFKKEYCPGQSMSHVHDYPEESETVQDGPGQSGTDIKTLVKEAISEQQSQLMKPIEEQALYRLGRLEEMVKHLEGEKEALRQENDFFRQQMKVLPGPVGEVTEKLQDQEKQILILRGELSQAREQAEKEKAEIAQAWKKELEMSKRPWWKRLF